MDICVLDGKKIGDIKQLHDFLAEELRLQDWYGRNLDALYDCLTDIGQETEIWIVNREDLEEHLGEYAKKLEKVIAAAAQSNPMINLE